MLNKVVIVPFVTFLCVVACGTPQRDTLTAIAEVEQREISIPTYPQTETSYLSFDRAHGFQITYLGEHGVSWLWYPGNRIAVPARFTRKTVGGTDGLCWRYPTNSYNPVTRTTGGTERCTPISILRKTTVAELKGDPFGLSQGKVPYRLNKCQAPDVFIFDRSEVRC